MIREVAGGKNAAEVLARAVAGDELIFDDKIDAVHKTLIDVGDKSRSIGHQLLGHASKVSDRLDRARLGLDGGRTKRLLSAFSNECRAVDVLGFLFLDVFKSVRGNRERREETFNRERTESTSEDARTTVRLNDATCRRRDRIDRFLLVKRFNEFDTSLLGRAVAEGLEAVGIDDVVASRLNFGFLLGSHTLLLKFHQLTRKLRLLFTEALQLSSVRLAGLVHLAFDTVEGFHHLLDFISHSFTFHLGERKLKLLDSLEQLSCHLFLFLRLPLRSEKLLGFCDDGRRGRLREPACLPQEVFKVTNGLKFVDLFGADFGDASVAVRREVHDGDLVELGDRLDDAAAVLLALVVAFGQAEADRKSVDGSVLHGRQNRVRLRIAWRQFPFNKQPLLVLNRREPLTYRKPPVMSEKHLRHAVVGQGLQICSRQNRVAVTVIPVKRRGIPPELTGVAFESKLHAFKWKTFENRHHCLTGVPSFGEDPTRVASPNLSSGTRFDCAVSASPPSTGGRFSRRRISLRLIAPFCAMVE